MPPDREQPDVSVLAVGGTIAMTGGQGRAVRPTLDAEALLESVPEIGQAARIRARTVATVPSPHMDLDLVARVARAVQAELAGGAAGVVITQGTDTIEESSFALELMLDTDAPVVITGAMRPPTMAGADGPANLLNAVQLAAAPAARGLGVAVLMDGAIHAPRHVAKTHTNAVSAFHSKATLIGEITEGCVTRLATPAPLPRVGIPDDPAPPVALVTATLGDDGRLLDALPDLGYAAVVIAGMGGGHVHCATARRIGRLIDDMPVVLASRTGTGATLKHTYDFEGSEIDLAQRGAIPASWLPPLKARIATALVLATGGDRRAIGDLLHALDGDGRRPGA